MGHGGTNGAVAVCTIAPNEIVDHHTFASCCGGKPLYLRDRLLRRGNGIGALAHTVSPKETPQVRVGFDAIYAYVSQVFPGQGRP